MYIGIDLGTSGVKAILLNEQGEVVASHTEKLTVSRPHPLWSEQDPEQWWLATDTAMKALGAQHSLRDVKALGIAGQMHGATLLDKSLQVLRPAILWNDGRCAEECQLLEEKVSASPADHRQPDDAGLYGAEVTLGAAPRGGGVQPGR